MSDAVFEVTTGPLSTVVVELSGNAANVMLVDYSNLESYKRGGRFRYNGGFYKRSPVTFRPGAGSFYVIVNVPGGRTNAKVSVQ